jgi:hypothetical protein
MGHAKSSSTLTYTTITTTTKMTMTMTTMHYRCHIKTSTKPTTHHVCNQHTVPLCKTKSWSTNDAITASISSALSVLFNSA